MWPSLVEVQGKNNFTRLSSFQKGWTSDPPLGYLTDCPNIVRVVTFGRSLAEHTYGRSSGISFSPLFHLARSADQTMPLGADPSWSQEKAGQGERERAMRL